MAFDRTRRGELLRAVLEVLAEHPEGIRAKDALAKAEARLRLTEYEDSNFESGVRRFEKLVRFQTVNAVKAGWMVKDKGTWTATDDGVEALKAYTDPETFMAHAEAEYRVWAKGRAKEKSTIDHAADGDWADGNHPIASATVEEAEETAFAEIANHLATMSPYDLQALVAGLLRGFTSDAASEARNSETRRITLVDESDLLDLWIEHYDRISADDRSLLPLKPVHYLAHADPA